VSFFGIVVLLLLRKKAGFPGGGVGLGVCVRTGVFRVLPVGVFPAARVWCVRPVFCPAVGD